MGKIIDSLANAGGLFIKGAALASVVVPGADFITDVALESVNFGGDFGDSFESFTTAAQDAVDGVADFTASTYNAVGINGLAVEGGNGYLTGADVSKEFGVIDDIVMNIPDTLNNITHPDSRMALGLGAVGGAVLAAESAPVQTIVHKGVNFTGGAARATANVAGELTKHAGNTLGVASQSVANGMNNIVNFNRPNGNIQGGTAQHRGTIASGVRAQQR
jgi:hypothetical protein